MYKAKELTSGSRASSAAFSVGVAAAPSFGVDSTFFDDFFLRKETLCAVEFERGGKRKKKVGWDGLKVVTQTIPNTLTFFSAFSYNSCGYDMLIKYTGLEDAPRTSTDKEF